MGSSKSRGFLFAMVLINWFCPVLANVEAEPHLISATLTPAGDKPRPPPALPFLAAASTSPSTSTGARNAVTPAHSTTPPPPSSGESLTPVQDNVSLYEEYDYEYDPSLAGVPLSELLPVTLTYATTFLLGVLGNALVVISILRCRQMRTVTNACLVSLASADFLLVVVCVPIKLIKWFTFAWIFGREICKTVHYLQNVSVICSIFTLTVISLERHYAILHPLQAKFACTMERARKILALIWLVSFLSATPILYGQIHKPVGVKYPSHWCLKQWPTQTMSRLYEGGMFIFVFALPLCVITAAYIDISRTLWKVGEQTSTRAVQGSSPGAKQQDVLIRRCRPPGHDDTALRKQVIKMLATIVLLFVICWGPIFIDNTLVAFGYLDAQNHGILKHVRQASALLSYFNSCVNPIVYAFMSKSFRKSFVDAICLCRSGPQPIQVPSSRLITVNTSAVTTIGAQHLHA